MYVNKAILALLSLNIFLVSLIGSTPVPQFQVNPTVFSPLSIASEDHPNSLRVRADSDDRQDIIPYHTKRDDDTELLDSFDTAIAKTKGVVSVMSTYEWTAKDGKPKQMAFGLKNAFRTNPFKVYKASFGGPVHVTLVGVQTDTPGGNKKRMLETWARHLQHITSPHLEQVKGLLKTLNNGKKKDSKVFSDYRYVLITESVGSSLWHFLQEQGNRYDEKDLQVGTLDLMSAVQAIHDANLIHRDIRPNNVFLTGKKFKLGGFANITDNASPNEKDVGRGAYKAPEIGHKAYDDKVDVFSLARTLVFMWSNYLSKPKAWTKNRKTGETFKLTESDGFTELDEELRKKTEDGKIGRTPEEVGELLKQFAPKVEQHSPSMAALLKYGLCGPEYRISIDEFKKRWEAKPSDGCK